MRLDSNIDSKSSNNILFNIIEILKKHETFKYHRIGKFSNNIDLKKVDFLSAEKLLNQLCVMYLFTKRECSLIFLALKKSSFLKSTLLPNFAFDVIYTGKIKNKKNISMMFK